MTVRDYYRSVLQLLTTSTVVTGQRVEFDEQEEWWVFALLNPPYIYCCGLRCLLHSLFQ
jgi:hypothetical protein